MKAEDTYFDRDVEKAFMKASAEMFEQKTKASLLISNQNGNMYTPSVYGCLASILAQYVTLFMLSRIASHILGQRRVGLFCSYLYICTFYSQYNTTLTVQAF